MKQNTLAAELYFSGIGIHTGLHADMKVCPAPENTGIRFQRVDIPGQPILKPSICNEYRTVPFLFRDNVKVSTLEHLRAPSLHGITIAVQLSAPDAILD
jgi:UDP-3-O-[3-hydroxymyristoyl] N-acetylglucosamine deacetylase/3-hydroxyacyl-[acyl-carrier-protein] dehydratase